MIDDDDIQPSGLSLLLRGALLGLLLLGFVALLVGHLIGEARRHYHKPPDWSRTPGIRVLLSDPIRGREEHDRVLVTAYQDCQVVTPQDADRSMLLRAGERVEFFASGSEGLVVRDFTGGEEGGALWPVTQVLVVPAALSPMDDGWRRRPSHYEAADRGAAWRVHFQEQPYRGILRLQAASAQTLLAINDLPIEAYLEGLLQAEMSGGWPEQALKAQAIAGRSYAYAHKYDSATRPFDLRDGGPDPTYRGTGRGSLTIDAAVLETHGQILTVAGEPFVAHFHAASGGYTASITDLDPQASTVVQHLPLTDVMRARSDPWHERGIVATDSADTHGRLEVELLMSRLREILGDLGHEVWPNRIEAVRHGDGSNRVASVFIRVWNGARQPVFPDLEMTGHEFRQLVGPDVIRSTLWLEGPERPQEAGEEQQPRFRFVTAGWGHGVGMSQISAFAMAEAGWDARRVLAFFYNGAQIERHWW